jgi:ubiquitin-protein ligase
MNLRERRMDTEWELLEVLAGANEQTLAAITRAENEFRIVMRESPAWVGGPNALRIETEHTLRYVYPRYYPALPLEGYFVRPVSHINVDPVTGFVCLWQEYQPAQTIVDAILITRAIMAYKAANHTAAHRMQQDPFPDETYSLPMPPLTIPEICRPTAPQRYAGSRRRLTSELEEQILRESPCALSDTERYSR